MDNTVIYRTGRKIESFNLNPNNVDLFTLMNKHFSMAIVQRTEDTYLGQNSTVKVYPAKFNGNIHVNPTPVAMNVSDIYGIINKISMSEDIQDAHPDIKIMNSQQLRRYADKSIQIELFNSLFPASATIDAGAKTVGDLPQETIDFLHRHTQIVVKSTNAVDANHITKMETDPEAILKFIQQENSLRLAKDQKPTNFIVQDFAPAQEVPGLKAKDFENQRIFDKYGGAIEIRAYCVGNQENQLVHFVGRGIDLWNAEGKRDEWVILNQDTIHPNLAEIAANTASTLLTKSDSKIGLIGVDFFYFNNSYLVREINLRDPMIPLETQAVNYNILKTWKEF